MAGSLVQSHTGSLRSVQSCSLCKYEGSVLPLQLTVSCSQAATKENLIYTFRRFYQSRSLNSCTTEEPLQQRLFHTFRQIVIRLKSLQSISKYFNRLDMLGFKCCKNKHLLKLIKLHSLIWLECTRTSDKQSFYSTFTSTFQLIFNTELNGVLESITFLSHSREQSSEYERT